MARRSLPPTLQTGTAASRHEDTRLPLRRFCGAEITLADASIFYRTDDELSITTPQRRVPAGVHAERGYRSLRVCGIFAVSTFDTDYMLVRPVTLAPAVEVLRRAAHQVVGAP
jgi:hypothetical protein